MTVQLKMNEAENAAYLILGTHPEPTKNSRFHTVVFMKDSKGRWLIESWHAQRQCLRAREMHMNLAREPRVVTVVVLLIVVWAGCTHNSVGPIISKSGDTTGFVANLSSINIQSFDSFAADQLVRIYWRTGAGDPRLLGNGKRRMKESWERIRST